jgi:ABC-2 type transport system permease protein
MRTILYIVRKEFLQVMRNKTMIPMIFALPVVQLVILVNAATMDMRNIDLIIVNQDQSSLSNDLSVKFSQSRFFTVNGGNFSVVEAENEMLMNNTDMILVIPPDFEKKVYREGKTDLQIQIDAINGMTASLINGYSSQIVKDFYIETLNKSGQNALINPKSKNIRIEHRFWYNDELNFKFYMVPGILAILLTVIGMFLASLNLVREKEIGTIEQINVTPIRKYQFIIGKLLPFWIIAMFELLIGLLIGKLLFNMPVEGNLFLLFAFAALYLVAVLGIGLLISTLSETQQQAQFHNFFVLVTFIMLSGIFTPAESMPHWAQNVNLVNPVAYFIRVNRMILLKGSGFADLIFDFLAMAVMAIVLTSLATWRYRKTA